jgi:hypothetical protein
LNNENKELLKLIDEVICHVVDLLEDLQELVAFAHAKERKTKKIITITGNYNPDTNHVQIQTEEKIFNLQEVKSALKACNIPSNASIEYLGRKS